MVSTAAGASTEAVVLSFSYKAESLKLSPDCLECIGEKVSSGEAPGRDTARSWRRTP